MDNQGGTAVFTQVAIQLSVEEDLLLDYLIDSAIASIKKDPLTTNIKSSKLGTNNG